MLVHKWNLVLDTRLLAVLKRTMEKAPKIQGIEENNALTSIFDTLDNLSLDQKWRTP